MMCDHNLEKIAATSTTTDGNEKYISIYQMVVKSLNSLVGADNQHYDNSRTITSNAATQNDKLEFEFENFIVSTVIWFIAIIIFILVAALIILVFMNAGDRRSNDDNKEEEDDDKDSFDTDLEKQELPVRLSIIEEEEEDDDEEDDNRI